MIVQLEEAKYKLLELSDAVKELASAIKIDKLTAKIEELEEQTAAPGFVGPGGEGFLRERGGEEEALFDDAFLSCASHSLPVQRVYKDEIPCRKDRKGIIGTRKQARTVPGRNLSSGCGA